MVVNFRAREISRGARKLTRTSTLNKKKKWPTRACIFLPTMANIARIIECQAKPHVLHAIYKNFVFLCAPTCHNK